MNYLSILLFLLVSTSVLASGEVERIGSTYQITKTVRSKYLKANQSRIRFTAKSIPANVSGSNQIVYSIDSKMDTANLNVNNAFFITTTPGNHVFQFFYSETYYEIYTDSISFKGGYQTNIDLLFAISETRYMTEKPVIYLYPETTQSVQVKLAPVGQLQFTYPEYGTGWDLSVAPNGTITHNGNNYPYLFWDAKTRFNRSSNFTEGYLVDQSNVVTFLEEQLTKIGLNNVEKTDFITYWGPRLIGKERVFIQFIWGTSADQFGKLDITPEPDHVNRLYIVWSGIDAATTIKTPSPQLLPTFDRSGFDVLEWGGTEIAIEDLIETLTSKL